MKRTKKNIVALLVALCMLVSIIPAMSAPVAQATDAAQQVINFQWKQDAIVPVTSATFDAGYDWQVNELKTSTALYGTLGAVGDSLLHPSYVQIGFRGANTYLALDFKVKEAGYYSLDITTVDLSSTDFSANAAVTIDEVALGNVIQKTDSDAATSEHAQNVGAMYLSAGEHTIVFTLQSAGVDAYNGNMYIKYLTLTPTEKKQVISFQWKQDEQVPVTSATYDAGYDWQVNELKTSTALYGTLGAVGDSLLHPNFMQIGFRGANTCLALDFKVKEAGYYSLDITTLDLSSADFSANAAVTIDEVALGNVIQKTDSDSATSEHAQNVGIIYLSAGEHTIVFTLQSAGADAYNGNMYFKYMTLTPTEKPNAEPEIKGDVDADSAFGTAYAYVEEHKDGTFKVTFVGGVDELEGFKAIGYEITVDSGEAAYAESNSVYKSLRIGEDVHSAAEYGGEFIFIGSQGNVKAGSKVTAKPYGVDANNNKVFHGVELTLQF